MGKLEFETKTEKELENFLESNSSRKIINFLNLHDLYQFKNNKDFRRTFDKASNISFIDGFIPSIYLSLTSFRKVSRLSGPKFTKRYLSSSLLSKEKKHLFLGLNNNGLKDLKKLYPHLKNPINYNLPFISGPKFKKEEIKKIINLINSKNICYVWIGIGSPKQNILSKELYEKSNAKYFFNVGAAIDFLLGKKREAPEFIRFLGLEWLYRLLTDFKNARKKVWRSLISLSYLGGIKLK
ncbi:MAG: WecB/TagA/CpsF family glycosyltransferase [Nanoarchaeota archaeon]|nr:WecB/TagA/CpsF family glycosyltransferase [Nanoarchaeota archaeon]